MACPIDGTFIDFCEANLGLSLPESFKKGMKEENGGTIETPEDIWFLHPIFDMSNRKRLLKTADHIVIETESSKALPGYPEGAVTIGSNKYGDLLVLLPEGNSLKDVVYKWDYKTGKMSVVSPTTEILMNSRM